MAGARTISGTVQVTWPTRYDLVLPDGAPPPRGFPLLLCLHGFGDDRARFRERLAGLLPAPFALLIPDAPFPVEMRPGIGGESGERRVGHAWYQFTGDQHAFEASLAFASEHLERVLVSVVGSQPVDPKRLAVLGYSQGGYLAGVMTLRARHLFRGLVAIACRIKTEMLGDALADAAGFPVLVVHGRRDEAVKLAPQEEAIAVLRRHGLAVETCIHDRGHGLHEETLPTIKAWVERR
jgi:predicted esterase